MDTGLDENKAELGVHVLAVALEMLADGDGLYASLVFPIPPCPITLALSSYIPS